MPPAKQSGIVHQNIQSSESSDRLVDQRLDLPLIRLPATTTAAPSSAKRRATARPIPLPPPVTMVTFPSNRFIIAAPPSRLSWFVKHPFR